MALLALLDRMTPGVVFVRHHRTHCLVGTMRDFETNRRVTVNPLWTWLVWPPMNAGTAEVDGKKIPLFRDPRAMIGEYQNQRCLLVPYAAHLNGVRGFDLI